MKLIPTALRVPNPAALQAAHASLEKEIAERKRVADELQAANDMLRRDAARGRLAAIVESSDDAIISPKSRATSPSASGQQKHCKSASPQDLTSIFQVVVRTLEEQLPRERPVPLSCRSSGV